MTLKATRQMVSISIYNQTKQKLTIYNGSRTIILNNHTILNKPFLNSFLKGEGAAFEGDEEDEEAGARLHRQQMQALTLQTGGGGGRMMMEESRIVLHEDKKYYPNADEVCVCIVCLYFVYVLCVWYCVPHVFIV